MAGLRKEQRLRRGADFQKVFAEGVKVETSLFRLLGRRNGGPNDRLGLAVSRRVGSAVTRNRGKRLVREGFRRRRESLGGIDMVVVAKPGIGVSRQQEVDRELERAIERLLGRIDKRRTGNAPGAPDH